jgi:hypothetical protein
MKAEGSQEGEKGSQKNRKLKSVRQETRPRGGGGSEKTLVKIIVEQNKMIGATVE